MIINEKPNNMLAEVTISARALADKCKDGSISTTWVRELEIGMAGSISTTWVRRLWI
jgi:hypothetical protein